MCDDCWIISGLISGGVALIVSLILIGVSVATMEPDEYGLIYNDNEQVVQANRLLTGGRYWVGLGKGILTFPRPEQAIVFATSSLANTADKPYHGPILGARTMEGLTIYLQVAVHYKLTTASDDDTKARQLASIYGMFGKDWQPFLSAISEAGIKNACSRHSFEDFYSKREIIETEIFNDLTSEFQMYHITLSGIFILNIAFPGALEDAVQSTENAKQEVEKYAALQTREEILRDTKISLAQKTKSMKVSEANSILNATTIQKTGDINAAVYVWKKYNNVTDSIRNLFTAAGVIANVWDYAVKYMWLKVLERHGGEGMTQLDPPSALES